MEASGSSLSKNGEQGGGHLYFESGSEVTDCLVIAPLTVVRDPTVVICESVLRVELDRRGIVGNGEITFANLIVREATIEKGLPQHR